MGGRLADASHYLHAGLRSNSGQTMQGPVSLVDLYPTLVELCGLPARDGLDGRSIAPLVRNPETEWKYPAVINLRDNHALRSERWHCIRYADGGEELYDPAKDPHQWKNLANAPVHAAARMELKKWLPKKNAPHFGAPKKEIIRDASARGNQAAGQA